MSNLVYPMCAMVALTFAVLISLFATRVRSVTSGAVRATYFKMYRGGEEPIASVKRSRNFVNLFEAPTLFYLACVTALAIDVASPLLGSLAWGYVALRAGHTYVHIGSNALRPRIALYFSSWIVLLAMWVSIAVMHRRHVPTNGEQQPMKNAQLVGIALHELTTIPSMLQVQSQPSSTWVQPSSTSAPSQNDWHRQPPCS